MSLPDGGRPRAVLVGAPGAGKTSVGRALARRWNVDFVDTDAVISAAAGKSVSDIFIEDGEPEFRRREAAAVQEALALGPVVVSLGGGAVIDPRTRESLLNQRVVWLQVSAGQAASRVGLSGARPLLMGNVRGRLVTLLDERSPWYAEVADIVVSTDDRSIDDIVAEIIDQVGAA